MDNTTNRRTSKPSAETNGAVDKPEQLDPTPNSSSPAVTTTNVFLLLLDWPMILLLVYGGCCTNAYSLEVLLNHSSNIGSALTFCQMCFITLYGLPSFVVLRKSFPFIGLRPSVVPAKGWAMQVFVLWFMSLLNNWAFAFEIPLTVQIVFRSGGPAVSAFYGYWLLSRRYNTIQLVSILFVTYGVILTSLSRPQSTAQKTANSSSTPGYGAGIALLTVALFLTGYLGYLQEKTYRTYKPWWKEGLFYTHALSLPLFIPLLPSIIQGMKLLSTGTAGGYHHLYTTVPLNLISQLACVAGVNMLTSRLSSVSTNLILTSRKAISLCISVWWFGSAWTRGMSMGSGLVGLGTIAYTWGGTQQKEKEKIKVS